MNTFPAYYNFHFGSLDCTAFGSTCAEHSVKHFPTFILYHNGEEVKRFEGIANMKRLSDFIEEVLETIKPGSRPIGGPTLPMPGDKSTEAPAPAPAVSITPIEDAKDSTLTLSDNKNTKETKTKAAGGLLKATPVIKNPAKPSSTPNPRGTSVSLTAESFQKSSYHVTGTMVYQVLRSVVFTLQSNGANLGSTWQGNEGKAQHW